MASDSPDERADSDEPRGAEPATTAASGAESTTDEAEERSYEEKVLDELVPKISVGDDEPTGFDAEPDEEVNVEEEVESLSAALGELDEDLQQAFLRIVVGIKAGVLLVSAGALAIGFQGLTTIGGVLIAVGGLAFARAGHRYWTYEHAGDESED